MQTRSQRHRGQLTLLRLLLLALQLELLKLTCHTQSVVACRCAPSQKAQLVELVEEALVANVVLGDEDSVLSLVEQLVGGPAQCTGGEMLDKSEGDGLIERELQAEALVVEPEPEAEPEPELQREPERDCGRQDESCRAANNMEERPEDDTDRAGDGR